MTTYASDNILGTYEKSVAAATGGTSRTASDKDMFLKLLVAQLSHQDPLNPVEDKEFVAQLAQFTSVEELQNINKGVESMNASFVKQQISSAASFMGTVVSARGDLVTHKGTYTSTLYATLPQDIVRGTANVYSTTADGKPDRLVYSETLGPTKAGTAPFPWGGTDNNGKNMPDGTYVVTISGVNASGDNVLVSTNSDGAVVAVEASDDGNHFLYLEDGRKVRYNDVQFITYPKKEEPKTPDNTTT